MSAANELVSLTRQAKRLEAALGLLSERISSCKLKVQDYMEDDKFPLSSHVQGASVHYESTVRASARDKDHERLTRTLEHLGLFEFTPKTVNANTISGYIREHIDPDKTKPLEERLEYFPKELLDALSIYEDNKVKVTGA